MIKEQTAVVSDLACEPSQSNALADAHTPPPGGSDLFGLKSLYEHLDTPIVVYQRGRDTRELDTDAVATQIYPETSLQALPPQSRLAIINTLNTLANKLKDVSRYVKFYDKHHGYSFHSATCNSTIVIIVMDGDTTKSDGQRILLALKNHRFGNTRLSSSDQYIRPENPIKPATENQLLNEKINSVLDNNLDLKTSCGLIASHVAHAYSVNQVIIAIGLEGDNIRVQGISGKKSFLSETSYIRQLEDKINSHEPFQSDSNSSITATEKITLGTCTCIAYTKGDYTENQINRLQTQLDHLIQHIIWPLLYNSIKHASISHKLSILIWPKFFRQIEQIRKTKATRIKLGVALILSMLLFLPIDYHISTEATIEGKIQQALVAPIDGYLISSYARAGDNVAKNTLIAELDNSDLQLELSRLTNLKSEYEKNYRKELAEFNQSDARIALSKIEQAKAEISLVEQQLKRTQLTAPFDGVIIKGDYSQSQGAPIARGDVLFEMSPANEYTLILFVKESDIRHINIDQSGHLYLKSQPNTAITFEVDKIAALAEASEDNVSYRVKATLNQLESLIDGTKITPGMEGIGKVYAGKKTLGWVLFHRPVNWLKFKLWWLLP